MPEIDDQHDPIFVSAIPCFMFVIIVENDAAALFPDADFISDAQTAIAFRNLNAEMATQTDICRATMCGYVGTRAQTRKIDQSGVGSDRVVSFDDRRDGRTELAVAEVLVATFVKEEDIPRADSCDRFAFRMKVFVLEA